MTLRSRLALTVLLTGLATALGVIVAVAAAFQRFGHESTWQRGDAFLGRVAAQHGDLLPQQQRAPDEVVALMHNLLLFEPDSQLYLLDPIGQVLASTGTVRLPPDFKVAIGPVRQAAAAGGGDSGGVGAGAAYVMGDDPEHMDRDAVIAARGLRPAQAGAGAEFAGYLYLVSRKPGLGTQQLALLRSSVASSALWPVLAVIGAGTLLAAWIIVTVTRPLRVLSEEVDTVARAGFAAPAAGSPWSAPRADDGRAPDEVGRLRSGFQALMNRLGMQWDELQRLDRFRRESVSNLSHDLRSPLTATVASLEMLLQRWQAAGAADPTAAVAATPSADAGEAAPRADLHLVEVALRNTRNAARMVRSLGDLALLDEPDFQLRRMRLNVAEVLDDIALRFADRALQQGLVLRVRTQEGPAPVAQIDVELFERAIANLLENALKFTARGGAVELGAGLDGGSVRVHVTDQGRGIAEADLPRLFDRLYRGRDGVAPASSDEGKGLGLAIVKRIVELHGGRVAVASAPGQGTTVTIELAAAAIA